MSQTKFFRAFITASLTSGLGVGLFSIATEAKSSNTHKPMPSSMHLAKCGGVIKAIQFKPPKFESQSSLGREQATTRCGGYHTLHGERAISLLPETANSLTTSSHPTLLIYNPYSSIREAEFSIFSRSSNGDDGAYDATISLPERRGIISIPIPQSVTLEPGKTYQWALAFVVEEAEPSVMPLLQGSIQPIALSPELAKRLRSAAPEQLPAIYAENGIWLDALSSLANLRCAKPNKPAVLADWRSLLTQVNLSKYAGETLLQCDRSTAKQ
ncbi:MAG: DUF928 domain-containing protein [Scytolyngbya sp. HA4215-MV1]|jgi:hypothetical protein|nr:DUF928 domain-containing protein [Scytolyngbya sp. HA4215-MV1]